MLPKPRAADRLLKLTGAYALLGAVTQLHAGPLLSALTLDFSMLRTLGLLGLGLVILVFRQ